MILKTIMPSICEMAMISYSNTNLETRTSTISLICFTFSSHFHFRAIFIFYVVCVCFFFILLFWTTTLTYRYYIFMKYAVIALTKHFSISSTPFDCAFHICNLILQHFKLNNIKDVRTSRINLHINSIGVIKF